MEISGVAVGLEKPKAPISDKLRAGGVVVTDRSRVRVLGGVVGLLTREFQARDRWGCGCVRRAGSSVCVKHL